MTQREALEKLHGQVWTTEEFRKDFIGIGHVGRFVTVMRRSDKKGGSMVRMDPVPHWDEKSSSFTYEIFYHSFRED